MIDEELLLEEIEKSMHDNPHTDGKIAMNHTTEHQHFIAMVNRQPKIGEWIPCGDHLPEIDMMDVLVTYKAMIDGGTCDGEYITSVGVGYYTNHHKKWNIVSIYKIKHESVKILAWQPLPKPYKEDI